MTGADPEYNDISVSSERVPGASLVFANVNSAGHGGHGETSDEFSEEFSEERHSKDIHKLTVCIFPMSYSGLDQLDSGALLCSVDH